MGIATVTTSELLDQPPPVHGPLWLQVLGVVVIFGMVIGLWMVIIFLASRKDRKSRHL